MSIRNEIKSQIVRAGFTMQEVVDLLHDEYGWSDSVSNLSAKLQRESIRYKEVVELAESKLLKVTAREVKSSYKTLTEFMVEAYNEAEEVCQAGGQAAGVPTGFPSLDRMLMGFRKGQLIIIGARPAVGKTSFALNLALNAAAAGYTVGFFSLEMSGKEIAQRLICAYAMISISDFRTGRISPEQWANINEATQTLSKLDILID